MGHFASVSLVPMVSRRAKAPQVSKWERKMMRRGNHTSSSRETLIKSKNQKSYEFLSNTSSKESSNSSLTILGFLFLVLHKNSSMISDNDLISGSLSAHCLCAGAHLVLQERWNIYGSSGSDFDLYNQHGYRIRRIDFPGVRDPADSHRGSDEEKIILRG